MRPLFWYQGCFLQPQHLQSYDQYVNALIEPLHRCLIPYFWGIHKLEIKIRNKAMELIHGEMIFPDHTYVSFPGNAWIEPRFIDLSWSEGGEPITVYLGLRKWISNGANVSVRDHLDQLDVVSTRYIAIKENPADKQVDLHHNGPDTQVERLYHVLKFFWESEMEGMRNEYEMIPIAQVQKTEDGIDMKKEFTPPYLDIHSSKRLKELITGIRDGMASHAEQLEGAKRKRGIHSGVSANNEINYLFALTSLNRYVPILYHLTEHGPVHPWAFYGVLRQIIGELSSFSDVYNSFGRTEDRTEHLPEYDHRNQETCFYRASVLISKVLQEVTVGPKMEVELKFDGADHSAALAASIFEDGDQFFLMVQSKEEPEIVINAIRNEAKVASKKSMERARKGAFSPLKLETVTLLPIELPPKKDAIYFKIDHHNNEWSKVKDTKRLSFFWRNAPKNVKIKLMVI